MARKTERFDIHQAITDQIVTARRPVRSSRRAAIPPASFPPGT